MLFNSPTFLVFLAVVATVVFVLPKPARPYILLAASYLFYLSWDAPMAVLLLAVTGISFLCGWWADRSPRHKKAALAIGLVGLLGALFFFKYCGFFLRGAAAVAALFGGDFDLSVDILLPVGISFYTFQALSYVIDVCRGKLTAEKNFFVYALYISFFPQLVAGPIERPADLLPQLKNIGGFAPENLLAGCKTMLLGFFEKIAVADMLGLAVDRVYGDLCHRNGAAVLVGTVLFGFQILCDFKGYSDIARGTARLFGIGLHENFNRPYLAVSSSDFWRRWHITLSEWFRDYLYIPLGGSRVSVARWCINILIVFLASGLWHGAAVTFVLWGLLHGVYQILGRALHAVWPTEKCPWLHRALTFAAVCFAWIFFRAASVDDAFCAVAALFTDWSGGLAAVWDAMGIPIAAAVLGGISLILFIAAKPLLSRLAGKKTVHLVYIAMLWLTVGSYLYLRCIDVSSAFIYFRF